MDGSGPEKDCGMVRAGRHVWRGKDASSLEKKNIGEASQTEEQEDVKGRTFSNWHRTKGKDKNAKTREI